MSDIKISGKIKLKTFQAEFCKKFPYLVPTIVNKEGTRLSNDYTIAKCNTVVNGEYSPIKVDDLSINGNLQVGTLEKRFMECFGIPCQVIYRKKGKNQENRCFVLPLFCSKSHLVASYYLIDKIVIIVVIFVVLFV